MAHLSLNLAITLLFSEWCPLVVFSFTTGKAQFKSVDPDVKSLENQLSEKIGVPVMIQHSAKGKGKLVLKYNNLDELDGILKHIK